MAVDNPRNSPPTLDDFERAMEELHSVLVEITGSVRGGRLPVPPDELIHHINMCRKFTESVHYEDKVLRQAAGLPLLDLDRVADSRPRWVRVPTEADEVPFPPLADTPVTQVWLTTLEQGQRMANGLYANLRAKRFPALTEQLQSVTAEAFIEAKALAVELPLLRHWAGYTPAVRSILRDRAQREVEARRRDRQDRRERRTPDSPP